MPLLRTILLALLCGIFLTPRAAFAMTVTPTQIEMTSAGRASRGAITVVNNSIAPLAVELITKLATLDESGVPKAEAADDEFLIMPPQAMIPPGATQNFRIQWLGDPLIETSRTFLIYVNQIPVKMTKKTSAVQVVFGMGVMVNVAPPHGQAALEVAKTDITTDARGRRHPVLTVFNPSNVHALFPRATVRVSDGSWSETITSGELAQSIGIGLVQPGHRRRFVLPVVVPPDVKSVKTSIQFNTKP
ncbi:conserved hypothetical protein [Hyphomicrobium denitrificans ATCC 51888]|uniref:Pili assembly chaperone N-terminal domain-containing protein n=1 Tax=Hyphomicrobium denitrificans (strain ATCC 51888 / DSM 1869 / NCIMB 11706 / TK 0415) TaxID=582899 RepID=D8JRM0_HYPDA|nr:fimbria/pilus periplasmic chaperone [Hyphomicrobium denitrificans]ADJ22249.1 conserved hypothetical protein [Hyphomicrobium denitrificans ATCC 51888]